MQAQQTAPRALLEAMHLQVQRLLAHPVLLEVMQQQLALTHLQIVIFALQAHMAMLAPVDVLHVIKAVIHQQVLCFTAHFAKQEVMQL